MHTSEILNRAADLLEERGWKTGGGWVDQLTPDGARLCLEGGIQAALGLRFNPGDDAFYLPFAACPAYQAVSTYLDLAEFIYNWNDAEGRTASEVVEVLRACAVIEASRERQQVSS